MIINDHLRRQETLPTPKGEKPRIAGACPNQRYKPGFYIG
jgi:hypothetical protein